MWLYQLSKRLLFFKQRLMQRSMICVLRGVRTEIRYEKRQENYKLLVLSLQPF